MTIVRIFIFYLYILASMGRKVIKQGHNTLTITLPNKWAERMKIKPGDELSIKEQDPQLILQPGNHEEHSRIELDISGMTIPILWKYVCSAYREGFYEIKLNFKDGSRKLENPYSWFTTHVKVNKFGQNPPMKDIYETLQDMTGRFIGMEVVEHTKNSVTLKELGNPGENDFEMSLRRIFLILLQMSEELQQTIARKNIKGLEDMHILDIRIDKFTDYCIRCLNKNGHGSHKQIPLLFSLIYLLEIIGDEFKCIAAHLIDDKMVKDFEAMTPMTDLLVQQMKAFYTLHYDFDYDFVKSIFDRDLQIFDLCPKTYSQISEENKKIVNHMRKISKFINAITELRIELELCKHT